MSKLTPVEEQLKKIMKLTATIDKAIMNLEEKITKTNESFEQTQWLV